MLSQKAKIKNKSDKSKCKDFILPFDLLAVPARRMTSAGE
jgi:hypothetical protein